jgi:hypothetical protein
MDRVQVQAPDGRLLQPCHPARARILVAEGAAVWADDRTVRLTREPSAGLVRSPTMTQQTPAITNFTKFFLQPSDIYVQNISSTQVAMQFDMGNGQMMPFILPPKRDPVNLTQHVPWDAVARSMDFRKLLNRRPPVLQLITEEAFNTFYEKRRAQQNLPSREAAIAQADEERQKIERRVLDSSDEARPTKAEMVRPTEGNRTVTEDELIHPRVLHLMAQVGPDVPDKDKMPARQMLEELQGISDQLKVDDLEMIRSKGFWKGVKTWAREEISHRIEAEQGEGADDPRDQPAAAPGAP